MEGKDREFKTMGAESPGGSGLSGGVRLNKFISEAGVCSRREADRLIAEGRVRIDGRTAEAGSRVMAGEQVTVDGNAICREEERILLAVNKPRGVVCTTDRRWGDETVYDMLNYPKRIFSIGRLDKDSEGLLLMTNQGDILNKIMRAGNYHEKEYLVTVDKEVTQQFLERMASGIYLEELAVTTRPCRVEQTGQTSFRIVLTQGLNRQIRRMCEACSYRVVKLVRVRIMNILLGDLEPGEYRSVSGGEYAELMRALRNSTNGPGGASAQPSRKQRGQSEASAQPSREQKGQGEASARPSRKQKSLGEASAQPSRKQKSQSGAAAQHSRKQKSQSGAAAQHSRKQKGQRGREV